MSWQKQSHLRKLGYTLQSDEHLGYFSHSCNRRRDISCNVALSEVKPSQTKLLAVYVSTLHVFLKVFF